MDKNSLTYSIDPCAKVDLNDTLRERGREGVEEVLRKHLLKIELD